MKLARVGVSLFSPAVGEAIPSRRSEKRARKALDGAIFSVTQQMRSHNRGRSTSLQAAPMISMFMAISAGLDDVATDVEDEVVIESALHVSGAAAASCYAKYGNPFIHGAPPLDIDWVDDEKVLGSAKGRKGKNKMTDEETDLAVCLATPMEPSDDSVDVQVRAKLRELARERECAEEDDIVEELEEAEEAILVRGQNLTRLRRRRADESTSENDGMAQRAGMDEVSNICSVHLDQSHNSLIRAQPAQDPNKKISGDLDAIGA